MHPAGADLRQDNDGPIVTKALTEIWNEAEVKFSETRRCICCWDEVLLSNFSRNDGVPNHFLRNKLGTDKGKARIDGVASDDCVGQDICNPFEIVAADTCDNGCPEGTTEIIDVPGVGFVCGPDASEVIPQDAALLGVAAKILHFNGSGDVGATSGSHLVGTDYERAIIYVDPMFGPGELREDSGGAAQTATNRASTKLRNGTR